MLATALIAAALVTATLSGTAGMGGGALLIGTMFALGMAPALALPLHAGVQLASNASRSLAYLPHVRWRALALFMILGVPAPFVVAPWVVGAEPDVIRLIMAAFVGLSVWPAWARRLRIHSRVGLVVAGGIAGMIGPIVGANGILVAPFFVRDDWRKEEIIATLAVGQSAGHLLKIAAFAANGFDVFGRLDLLVPMAIAALAGTLIGRRLVGLFSEHTFRTFVGAIMLVLAIKLAYDGVVGLMAPG